MKFTVGEIKANSRSHKFLFLKMKIEKRKAESISLWLDQPKNLPVLSLFCGGLGGVLMILKFLVTTNGHLIFVPYAILVIGFFWLIKSTEISYYYRFLAGVASFMTANIILYFYTLFVLNPKAIVVVPLWRHLCVIAMMFGIAVAINGAMTYLQRRFETKLL